MIGGLFGLSGASALANLAHQRAARLAIEQINALGGIPAAAPGAPARPLLLVSCDESIDLDLAAEHLLDVLRVPAIVGPSTCQDMLDLARDHSIEAGALVVSPTAISESIAHLLDGDLAFQMLPGSSQRTALMIGQLAELESQLRLERGKHALDLAIIHSDDALGADMRAALASLQWNDRPLTDPRNLGVHARIEAYDLGSSEHEALLQRTLALGPDVIVLIGGSEAVTQILLPLEQRWGSTGPDDGAERPYYVLTESSRVPELLQLAATADDLARRVRGSGSRPTARSVGVHEAFVDAYAARYEGDRRSTFGLGATYDATHAIALAIAAAGENEPRGESLARGLRALADGSEELELRGTGPVDALRQLASGGHPRVIGTFAPLGWDDNGAIASGSLEAWCLANGPLGPSFRSAEVSFDVATQRFSGSSSACEAARAPLETTQLDPSAPDIASGEAASAQSPQPAADGGADEAPAPGMSAPSEMPPEPATQPTPPEPPRELTVLEIDAEVRRDTTWTNGYCASASVHNTSQTAGTWHLELVLFGSLTDFWSCVATVTPLGVRFSGASWNAQLEPGASAEFGYCVAFF